MMKILTQILFRPFLKHQRFFLNRYSPPEAAPNAKEQVIVNKVFLADETKKREIYVLSDMHLGGEWSKNTVPALRKFLVKMAKIAEEFVHTIVMLGDVFEMWMTPITMSPVSNDELIKIWKDDEVKPSTVIGLTND